MLEFTYSTFHFYRDTFLVCFPMYIVHYTFHYLGKQLHFIKTSIRRATPLYYIPVISEAMKFIYYQRVQSCKVNWEENIKIQITLTVFF